MDNPLVSIILPIYNVYSYLAQCLDSIIAQTYKNIEVIIIIDGATDGSYELAKEYCQRDSRFNVYWQENAGSGSARNNGLSHATGEFVMFIDPDDWTKEDYVEQMLNAQKERDYDLVIATSEKCYFSEYGKIKFTKCLDVEDQEFIGEQTTRHHYAYLLETGLIIAPHGKLYKGSIIYQHNIRFPDLRRSQDFVFNYRYYDFVKSVRTVSFHRYCYRIEFSNRLARLKPNYYLTIKLLFEQTTELHYKWGEENNIPIVATKYTEALSSAIESCVVTNEKINHILLDESLRSMVKKSRPKSIVLRCFKLLYLGRCNFLLKIMLNLKNFIKQKYLT